MCVIIYKPEGVKLSEAMLRAAWDTNSDGAGIASWNAESGVWESEKGYMTFADFWQVYEPLQDRMNVIHFRIGTHGAKTPENTHPFGGENGSPMLFHNGTMRGFGDRETKSDTEHFYEKLFSHMGPEGRHELLRVMVRETTSKFALIEEPGKVVLFGDFQEKEGAKCSNLFFSWRTSTTYYGDGRSVTTYTPDGRINGRTFSPYDSADDPDGRHGSCRGVSPLPKGWGRKDETDVEEFADELESSDGLPANDYSWRYRMHQCGFNYAQVEAVQRRLDRKRHLRLVEGTEVNTTGTSLVDGSE